MGVIEEQTGLDDTTRSPRWRGGRQDALVAGIAALAAAIVFLRVRGSLIDDAYITLSYARNLAEHLHWGLTASRTANSATSPLNVLVLAAGAVVVRDAVWGLGLVFVLLNALQGWALSRLVRHLRLAPATAPVCHLVVLLSPLMLSVVGMEMTLAFTLVLWATVAAVEGRPVLLGLMGAALLLTRVDLVVFPIVLLLTQRAVRRRPVRVLLPALAVALPWYLFSWLALGALLPDTLVIKTASGSAWGPWSFLNGPGLYWERYPAATLLSAVPAVLGVVALVAWAGTRAWRSPRWAGLGPVAAVGIAGVLHYAAYSVLAPPPFHWYYAPSVTALTLVTAVAAGRAATAPRGARTGATRRVGGLLPLGAVGLVLLTDAGFAAQHPWAMVPISTNWATADQYLAVGAQLGERADGRVVRSPGEIGTLAYGCGCDIVDPFSDRGTLQPMIDERLADAGPLMRALLRLNFANLERQPAAEPDLLLEYGNGPDAPGEWPVRSNWMGPGAFRLAAP